MVFCTYEDRPECLVGLRILVRSLARHMPQAKIRIWCPPDKPGFAEFLSWFERQENALPHPDQPIVGAGWNVKPYVLLYELERGAQEAIWIDADIILGGDPSPMLKADDKTIVATEGMKYDESPKGTKARTIAWGYQVGRDIPGIVSSSVVRVTQEHVGLLREWARILQSQAYNDIQMLLFWDRPPHAAGDQDVLMALLGAEEFSWIPIRYIPSGKGIAHCYFSVGYTSGERLGNAFSGPPPFVHAPSPIKPWNASIPLSVELSPYPWVAAGYEGEVGEPLEWARLRSGAGRFLNLVFLGNPNLRGIPLSIMRETKLYLDGMVRKLRAPKGTLQPSGPEA